MKGKSGGHRPGGGIASRQHVSKPVQIGQRARAIRERGVSQIGQGVGDHSTEHGKKLTKAVEPVRGGLKPSGGPGGVELGNECALNVKGGGPGTGRTLYGQSGTQGVHGPVAGAPRPQGRSFDAPATKRQEGF